MSVLIACEESQAVCSAFRELGIEAFSCDIIPCSGGHPEWHIMQDVLPLLNGNCSFSTMLGTTHHINGRWDMIIAHPPCTDLSISGARHFARKRADGSQRASIEFFCQFLVADCELICIENPINIISGNYITEHFPDLARQYGLPQKPSQIIQPFEFGDPFRKATSLWLKNLPLLQPTCVVEPNLVYYKAKDGKTKSFSADYGSGFYEGHGKRRSKTYPGIAKAIAEQWSPILLSGQKEKLYFINSRGEYVQLAESVTENEANAVMSEFMNAHNFKCYYVRSWKTDEGKMFDVGSHTEFFLWGDATRKTKTCHDRNKKV